MGSILFKACVVSTLASEEFLHGFLHVPPLPKEDKEGSFLSNGTTQVPAAAVPETARGLGMSLARRGNQELDLSLELDLTMEGHVVGVVGILEWTLVFSIRPSLANGTSKHQYFLAILRSNNTCCSGLSSYVRIDRIDTVLIFICRIIHALFPMFDDQWHHMFFGRCFLFPSYS